MVVVKGWVATGKAATKNCIACVTDTHVYILWYTPNCENTVMDTLSGIHQIVRTLISLKIVCVQHHYTSKIRYHTKLQVVIHCREK